MKLLAIALTLACFMAVLPNVGDFQFLGEEARRTIVAYEMSKTGNLAQPTFLGEPYYNKPPLFNWLILLSSKLIPWSELTARAVTLTSLLLILIVVYALSRLVVRDRPEVALMAPLVFISFSDVLFWYGYLAEIDITLTMVNTLIVLALIKGVKSSNYLYICLSGLLTGVSFLLKGIPSYAFWFLSSVALILFYRKELNAKFYASLIIAGLLSMIIPLLWLLQTQDPQTYTITLLRETFSKVKGDSGPLDFLTHALSYPLLNLKQLLPASLIVLYAVLKRRIRGLPDELKALLLICLLNYLPYIVSAGSRGRYVLPLFPLLAIVFAYVILQDRKLTKFFFASVVLLAVLRLAFGVWGLPLLEKQRGPLKKTAYTINSLVKREDILACECRSDERRAVCLYLDFLRNDFIKTRRLTPNWNYLVACRPVKGEGIREVLKVHIRKDQYVYLYLKGSQDPRR